jgi:hypothetical protein
VVGMYKKMKRQRFVYHHILKTAGTTFRRYILDEHFQGRYCYDDTFKIKRNELVKRTELNHPIVFEPQPYPKSYEKYDVIFGHFVWTKYNHLKRPKVVFLRDPVERIISNYFYFQGLYKKEFDRKNYNIFDFINTDLWKNHMTYVLGDITKYDFVGIVERYYPSIRKFCNLFGIPQVRNIIEKRRTENKRPISITTRNKIRDLNIEDQRLYDKGRNMFERLK